MSSNSTKIDRSLELRPQTIPPLNPAVGETYNDAVLGLLQWTGTAWKAVATVTVGQTAATIAGVETLTNKKIGDTLSFKEAIVTPTTPDIGFTKIYPKSDGSIYSLTSTGIETKISPSPTLSIGINNNQITPTNLPGAFAQNGDRAIFMDYYVSRYHGGDPEESITALSDAGKFNSQVWTSAVGFDGSVYFGGFFGNYSGVTGRDYFLKTSNAGLIDTTFMANAVDGSKFNGTVRCIATQQDGKVLVGGDFVDYGGAGTRNRFIRLNIDGTVDATFCNNASGGGKFNSTVRSIIVQPDDKIVVAGSFTNYAGGINRNFIVRLNPDGTEDTSFNLNIDNNFSSTIQSIALQTDGKIVVGGWFNSYGGYGGRNHLVRLNDDGTLDTLFCNNGVDGGKFNDWIVAVNIQPDGKILAGGLFTDYNGISGRNRLIRLNTDGTEDTLFNSNASDGNKFSSQVNSIKSAPSGRVIVGGFFSNYNGVTGFNYLVALTYDGFEDFSYNAAASNNYTFSSPVYNIFLQSDERAIITGDFTGYKSFGRNYMVRLKSDGNVDLGDFDLNQYDLVASSGAKFNNTVDTFKFVQTGKAYVGGSFVNYSGKIGRSRLVKLNADGTEDTPFMVNAVDGTKFNSTVHSIDVQLDNKVLVAGSFTDYSGVLGKNFLLRLNPGGTEDSLFNSNAVDGGKFNASISVVVVQPDGKILVGGSFTDYDGVIDRNRLIRLNDDGTLDTTFCNNAVDGNKFNGGVYSIAVQPNGKILVGGFFNNYNGFSGRDRLVRLNADGTLDTIFCNNATDFSKFGNAIVTIALQTDGKILVGGYFDNYYGYFGKNRLVRLNADGTEDYLFNSNAVDGSKFNNEIRSIAIQSDGKILVGGSFVDYNGISGRNRLIRLNSNGTEDTTFGNNIVSAFKFNDPVLFITTGFNKTIIGGIFTNYNYTTGRDKLLVLSTQPLTSVQQTGTLAGAYDPASESWQITQNSFYGDVTGLTLNLTTQGQVQYTTSNIQENLKESLIKFSFKKI